MERHALFRKAALDKLASPERLDVLVQVTSPMGWLALWTTGVVLAGAILWSIFGSIPERIDGQGILLRGALREIRAAGEGSLASLTISLGDVVAPGQVVATLAGERSGGDMRRARERFEAAVRAHRVAAADPDPARRGAAEAALDLAQADLERAARVAGAPAEVKSPVAGKVVEIKRSVGDRVTDADAIAIVEPHSGPVQVVAYVSATVGKRIRPNMAAEILPTEIKPGEYGFMVGTVERMGDFPVGSDRLANEALARTLTGAGPVFEMRARLKERNTPSGFEWSTSDGPPSVISSGTLVHVSVIVARRQPISLVLPFLRRTAGLS